jgi:hypothetical protein
MLRIHQSDDEIRQGLLSICVNGDEVHPRTPRSHVHRNVLAYAGRGDSDFQQFGQRGLVEPANPEMGKAISSFIFGVKVVVSWAQPINSESSLFVRLHGRLVARVRIAKESGINSGPLDGSKAVVDRGACNASEIFRMNLRNQFAYFTGLERRKVVEE